VRTALARLKHPYLVWFKNFLHALRGGSNLIAMSGRDPVTGERWQYVEGEDAADIPGVVTLEEPPDDPADPFSRRARER
jgi:hypothetical protein